MPDLVVSPSSSKKVELDSFNDESEDSGYKSSDENQDSSHVRSEKASNHSSSSHSASENEESENKGSSILIRSLDLKMDIKKKRKSEGSDSLGNELEVKSPSSEDKPIVSSSIELTNLKKESSQQNTLIISPKKSSSVRGSGSVALKANGDLSPTSSQTSSQFTTVNSSIKRPRLSSTQSITKKTKSSPLRSNKETKGIYFVFSMGGSDYYSSDIYSSDSDFI